MLLLLSLVQQVFHGQLRQDRLLVLMQLSFRHHCENMEENIWIFFEAPIMFQRRCKNSVLTDHFDVRQVSFLIQQHIVHQQKLCRQSVTFQDRFRGFDRFFHRLTPFRKILALFSWVFVSFRRVGFVRKFPNTALQSLAAQRHVSEDGQNFFITDWLVRSVRFRAGNNDRLNVDLNQRRKKWMNGSWGVADLLVNPVLQERSGFVTN